VLILGVGVTVAIFFVAKANVHNSERSLARERTSQTLGVIATVVQQVEAIVASGAAAAEYTDGDPQAFEDATAGRVALSLVSDLSLLRLRGGRPTVLASAGRSPPLLLGRLTARDRAALGKIARAGSGLTYVSGERFPGGRTVGFAMSPRAGSDLLLWGEITTADAQAQAGGVASSDLRFAIYLGAKPRPATLLLSSPDGIPKGDGVVTDWIPIGDERLLVTLGPRHRLVGGFTWAGPWIMLAIGLVGSLAIAAFVLRDRRRRDEALRLVGDLERRTSELHRALAEQWRAEQEAQAAAERLRQGQRLEAIGQLAGGIAHDFNNLLTAIIGSTRLLLRGTRPGEPVRRGLEDIERAADRAASLTQQLLAFSRRQMLQPTVVDLNRIVRETETMLRHLIRANIRLHTSLEPGLGAVEADGSQLEQVILNLVVNAADAIRDSGTIEISTAGTIVAAANADGRIAPGRYAVLSVSDDGVGMDGETRDRVFEPFFTTKELGRGTGLGLATVYGIVEQSGGSIDVESEPGRGTTFRISLPTVDKAVEEPVRDARSLESTAGTETVVVAEDDDMVRTLVCVTLQESGYTVLEAATGDAALELCERHAGQIDALVTDMVMPGIGGRALADRLTTLRPELRVLFVSGYAQAEVLDRDSADTETSFLPKPFTPEELASRVRALIDRPHSAP
jgi:signal transduction histidine kinase